ncbi:MAG: peptidyl-prolyl cis-trans isomerase, partial [Bacteroidota bacterium]|nr:peptidyl-prolyl cis-trans isomerase [Bacteroidota bacterium]
EQAYAALQASPQQFNEWVKISGDKRSIATNGILPWISAGQSEFDKALIKLTKPGEISEPFKTANGYEIFRLIAYEPASQKSFSKVKEDIINQLQMEKAQALYAQQLESLADLSYQTPDSLQPVVDDLKIKLETSEPFSKEGGSDLVTRNKQVVNTAFSHDVLELGNNSEPVQLDSDTVVVLRVLKHLPSKEKNIEEVRAAILNKLAVEKAEEKTKALAALILKQSQDSTENAKLMETNKLAWKDIENATRHTDKIDLMINDLAFSLPKENAQDGRRLVNGDFVIVRLKKIVDGQYKNLDKEQQASIAQQIEASNGLMEYDLYVNRLIKTAKIDRDGKS